MNILDISKDDLERYTKDSISYAQIIQKCGLSLCGYHYKRIKNLILENGIDCSHLRGRYWPQGYNKNNNPSIRKISIANTRYSVESLKENTYISTKTLRRLLCEAALKVKCVKCGITDTYNNKPIVLQIDHINGNQYDNRLENLRYLCPTCHSQVKTNRNSNGFDYSSVEQNLVIKSNCSFRKKKK